MAECDQAVEARMTRGSWLSLAFVVPIVAVAIAGWLLYRSLPEEELYIELRTADAEGIEPVRTPLRYRGVEIGRVDNVALSGEFADVVIGVRLEPFASEFARQGARFWIARPELKLGQVSGLRSIITGSHIEAEPGDGEPATEFTVLDSAPLSGLSQGDLPIVLIAATTKSLTRGSGIYYRGLQIGLVEHVALGADNGHVRFDARIFRDYRRLVRSNSVFWMRSGLSLDFGLFKGIQLDADSLQTLLSGAIEMATPAMFAEEAVAGEGFGLADDPPSGWESWVPALDGDESAGTAPAQ
jgi:paraquat-inducible protein B